MPEKTLIVFAPHPDDETLGPGGTVAKKISEGFNVVVVILTDGRNLFKVVLKIDEDPSPQEVADFRMEESVQVARVMGMERENLLFLGYEDGSLKDNKDKVVAEVAEILEKYKPVEIMSTCSHEGHGDHNATNEIVKEACRKHNDPGLVLYEYITSLRWNLTFEDVADQFTTRVDVAKYLPIKKKALSKLQSHLGICSVHQKEPITKSFDEKYVTPEEVFSTWTIASD